MGGKRLSERVFEYMRTHPNIPVSVNEISNALDLTQGQVRPVMRRFIANGPTDKYFTVVVPANSWIYNPRPESSPEVAIKALETTVDTGARRAREVGRAVARATSEVTYTRLDELANGDVLLRSSDDRLYRATITEL